MSLNFTHKRGDTFEAVNFEIMINEVAVDLTDTVIRMQLRKEYGGVIALNLTSVDNAGLTIIDAINGLFKINEQIINIDAGNYLYDIQFNFDGEIKTYVSGNFLITNDVTR
jgi:glyoxylate utilization-related uncharacterized protein